VMERFLIEWDDVLYITDGGLVLPEGANISPARVLSEYVELGRVALQDDIEKIASFAGRGTKAEKELMVYVGNDDTTKKRYEDEIFKKRVSPLDLLEKYPDLLIDLGSFLSILPPIEYRRYSISSSPRANPKVCTLTYSVVHGAAFSGNGNFHGVSSTYLSRLEPEFTLEVSTVSSDGFHLPAEQAITPVIMVGAGTGIAPFRGFVQERAALRAENPTCKLAPALLFFGCRYPEWDRIHGNEFDCWESAGLVKVYYKFSSEGKDGDKYVQHILKQQEDTVCKLLKDGARMYVCGQGRMGQDVRAVFKDIFENKLEITGDALQKIFDERLHEDVFN